jgi:hypothetical protein
MGCYAGYPGLDYMYPGPGFGYGWGRGFGRGWRHFGSAPFWGYPLPPIASYSPIPGFRSLYDPWGAAELTPELELKLLKAEAELLEDELAGIENRTKELEGKKMEPKLSILPQDWLSVILPVLELDILKNL